MTIQEWTETPAREPVVTEVRHETTRHGMEIVTERMSFTAWIRVRALLNGRLLYVSDHGLVHLSVDAIRARALALADDLHAAGFRGEATNVEPTDWAPGELVEIFGS